MISIKVSSHDTMRLYISKEIEEKREEKALRAKKEEGALDFIADVITLKRKKILVFYNEASSFTLLYNRPEKSNYKKIDKIFSECLSEYLRAENVEYDLEAEPVEIFKAESKSALAKVRERIAEYDEYISDDDKSLTYVSHILGGRKKGNSTALKTFLDLNGLKQKDRTLIIKIEDDRKREVSLLFPSLMTLKDLRDSIVKIYDLSDGERSDFVVFSPSSLDYMYRSEEYRALDFDLDDKLKKKGCSYAHIKSAMLNLSPKDLIFRYKLEMPRYFKVSFDGFMEDLSRTSPIALSCKWRSEDEITLLLKGIKS